jgi:hypothetical protein
MKIQYIQWDLLIGPASLVTSTYRILQFKSQLLRILKTQRHIGEWGILSWNSLLIIIIIIMKDQVEVL